MMNVNPGRSPFDYAQDRLRASVASREVRHEVITDVAQIPSHWQLEPHASLMLLHHIEVPAGLDHALTVQFFLAPSSSLFYAPIITGGATVRITIELFLEEGAQATINGIYCMPHNQQYHIITKQHHRGPRAASQLRMNGVVAGTSMLNYSGIIAVDAAAAKTQASQENKTILIGAHARAISIPALEVLTDDVQCAHGSATSSFDREQVWYLQSRGLAVDRAQYLMLAGFFEQTLSGILDFQKRDTLVQSLVRKAINDTQEVL
jgi:hypothetical protein